VVITPSGETAALLSVEGLRKEYPVRRGLLQRRRGTVHALAGVDLRVRRGECLALVGESGSGKTTLGRCALRLIEPTAGRVTFDGEDLLALEGGALRARRRRFQMVFQDPYGSLDPRQRVGSIVAEPLGIHTALDRAGRAERAAELLAAVGLAPALATRFPHELSGGQRQRVGIARALAPSPDLLVADEPVSSLDVSVRGQILDLLSGLRERLGLAMLLIAHDIAAVERLADRVAVMYLGRIVELAPARELLTRPLHPYTASLLSAVPVAAPRGQRRRVVLPGEPPSPLSAPPGCPFHPRCPSARPRCAAERPPLAPPGGSGAGAGGAWGRVVACFYPGELPMPGSKQDTVAS
jgi:oligopeptide/dipeptide ABC transporter ATP-binding protein